MRIFVEPGGYRGDNLGDHAMLEVTLRRLRRLWPDAQIRIHSLEPEAVLAIDPALDVLDPIGLSGWTFETGFVGDGPTGALAGAALDLARGVRRRWPRFSSGLGEVALQTKGLGLRRVARYVEAVTSADLVLMSGAGALNDAFRRGALRRLETLELGMAAGAATALVGQGIGPMRDTALRRRAAAVLPRVDLLALREGIAALPLLEGFGRPRDRSIVTGDDAIATAYAARPDVLGASLGVNLRVAPYSGIGDDEVRAVAAVVREGARRRGAKLVSVPITRDPATDDSNVARRLIGEEAPGAAGPRTSTVAEVLRALTGCRVVVAGSYHAAVFALSMGVPAIAVVGSEYYAHKFRGLADQFGTGCSLEAASHPDFAARLGSAIDRAWASADESREPLLEAARKQIAAGEAAFGRLFEIVEERGRRRA